MGAFGLSDMVMIGAIAGCKVTVDGSTVTLDGRWSPVPGGREAAIARAEDAISRLPLGLDIDCTLPWAPIVRIDEPKQFPPISGVAKDWSGIDFEKGKR